MQWFTEEIRVQVLRLMLISDIYYRLFIFDSLIKGVKNKKFIKNKMKQKLISYAYHILVIQSYCSKI